MRLTYNGWLPGTKLDVMNCPNMFLHYQNSDNGCLGVIVAPQIGKHIPTLGKACQGFDNNRVVSTPLRP
jgi:hypothetical protein